jgi:uridine phosphorylase
MATVNPTRAELIAITIAYKPEKERALHDLAVAVAATDPDNAERIAKTIKEGPVRAETKRDVATVIAAADPDRAERIANSIAIKSWSESGKIVKAAALANIARTILLS